MKTPMQELIEKIDTIIEANEFQGNKVADMKLIKLHAIKEIEKEKQVIIDAWEDGRDCTYAENENVQTDGSPEQYYNETFKS